MFYNDLKWLIFWLLLIGDCVSVVDIFGFLIGRYVGEDLDIDWLFEIVGYVVIEVGMYEIDGMYFYVKLGDDLVCGVSNSSIGYFYEIFLG